MNHDRFAVVPLEGDLPSFAVVSKLSFDDWGLPLGSSIINIFMGPDSSEADRYCRCLNDAIKKFFEVIPD